MPEVEFIPESILLAVKHGAAFLDEHEPGWEKRLDLESLAMHVDCQCVIGQLKGEYAAGLDRLGIGRETVDIEQEVFYGEAVDLGFYVGDFGGDEWPLLTEAWRREVRSRTGDES